MIRLNQPNLKLDDVLTRSRPQASLADRSTGSRLKIRAHLVNSVKLTLRLIMIIEKVRTICSTALSVFISNGLVQANHWLIASISCIDQQGSAGINRGLRTFRIFFEGSTIRCLKQRKILELKTFYGIDRVADNLEPLIGSAYQADALMKRRSEMPKVSNQSRMFFYGLNAIDAEWLICSRRPSQNICST